MNFAKFLKTSFFITSPVAASVNHGQVLRKTAALDKFG